MTIPINPDTRLDSLIESEPAAAEALWTLAPDLKQLRNAVLRQAVARSTTLAQVARLAGIPVPALVRELREAAGHPAPDRPVSDEPAWLAPERVEFEIDANAMLSAGEHPLGRVRSSCAQLSPGGIVRLTVAFRPEPLLEAIARAGFAVYCRPAAAGGFEAYFCRLVAPASVDEKSHASLSTNNVAP